jgi:hypothetical protein
MSINDSYRPRLSVEISTKQANDLRNLIPWGLKNQLFSIIVDDVIRLSLELGPNFLAAILAHSIKLENYSSVLKEEPNGSN